MITLSSYFQHDSSHRAILKFAAATAVATAMVVLQQVGAAQAAAPASAPGAAPEAAPKPIAQVCAKYATTEASNRALKRNPNDNLALMCRAAAYLEQGAPDKAAPDLKQLLQRKVDLPQLYLLQGQAELAQGNPNQAIVAYQQAIALNEEWPEAYLELAAAQSAADKMKDAVQSLSLARLYLADPVQRAALGKSIQDLQAGKPLPEFASPDGRTMAELNSALKANPNDLETRLARVHLYVDQGQTRKALADLSAAIKLDPKNADLYVQRGLAYAQLNNGRRASADFDQAVRLAPDSPIGYSARATYAAQRGNYAAAVRDFTAAIRIDSESDHRDPYLYFNRGMVQFELGQNDLALDDFNTLVAMDTTLIPGYIARAQVYDNREDFDKAIEELDQAITLSPNSARLLVIRGRLYVSRLNDSASAMKDFDKAIALQPNNIDAHYERGVSLAEDGNYTGALNSLNAVLKINGRNALALSWRGYTNLGLGKFQDAVRDSSAAIKLLPRQPQSYCDRGEAYKAMGDKNKALRDFQQCLRYADASEEDLIAHTRDEIRALRN